jgi:hypothetical protein
VRRDNFSFANQCAPGAWLAPNSASPDCEDLTPQEAALLSEEIAALELRLGLIAGS